MTSGQGQDMSSGHRQTLYQVWASDVMEQTWILERQICCLLPPNRKLFEQNNHSSCKLGNANWAWVISDILSFVIRKLHPGTFIQQAFFNSRK